MAVDRIRSPIGLNPQPAVYVYCIPQEAVKLYPNVISNKTYTEWWFPFRCIKSKTKKEQIQYIRKPVFAGGHPPNY